MDFTIRRLIKDSEILHLQRIVNRSIPSAALDGRGVKTRRECKTVVQAITLNGRVPGLITDPDNIVIQLGAFVGSRLVGGIMSETEFMAVTESIARFGNVNLARNIVKHSRNLALIAIEPKYRRSGIGAALLDRIIEMETELGYTQWSGVATSVEAERLLQSRGFTVHDVRNEEGYPMQRLYSGPSEDDDAFVFSRSIEGRGFHLTI